MIILFDESQTDRNKQTKKNMHGRQTAGTPRNSVDRRFSSPVHAGVRGFLLLAWPWWGRFPHPPVHSDGGLTRSVAGGVARNGLVRSGLVLLHLGRLVGLLREHHNGHNHADDQQHAERDADAQPRLLAVAQAAVVVRSDHNRGSTGVRRCRVGRGRDQDAVDADHRVRVEALHRDALRVVQHRARRERLLARHRGAHGRARGHGVAEPGVRVGKRVGVAVGGGDLGHRRHSGRLAHSPLSDKLVHEHARAAARKLHRQRLGQAGDAEEHDTRARAPVRHLRSVVAQHLADQRREALNLRVRRRARQAGVVRHRVAE
eukprot:Rhum_TRINITY_DN15097_c1_g7::Rhum_TRINITY_DN15097_c1_g7_i1::g.133172::m.133172